MAGKSLNKATLIGNLGKDPEVSYTASGVAVAKFSIATNERWKDAEGNVQASSGLAPWPASSSPPGGSSRHPASSSSVGGTIP